MTTHVPRHPATLMVSLIVTLLSTAAVVGLTAGPALAACHVAGFFSTDLDTSESVGSIDVTVFLQGRQPSCAGTVDFATADGSAVAGEDYEAASGTLRFESGDDREETVTITILGDDTAEDAEDFFLMLSNPTEGISNTSGPATITIAADDGAAAPGTDETAVPAATPDSEPTTDADADQAASAAGVEDSGGSALPIVLVVLVVLVGLGSLLVARNRQT